MQWLGLKLAAKSAFKAQTWNQITGNTEKKKRKRNGPNNRKIEEVMLTEGHFQKANGAQISDIVSPISHPFVRDIIFIITLDYAACN